jgi:hypothetical protein
MDTYNFTYRKWWKLHTIPYVIPSDAKAVSAGKGEKKALTKDGETWTLKSITTSKGKLIHEVV